MNPRKRRELKISRFFFKYRVIFISLNNEIARELLVKVENIGCIKPEKV